MELWDVYNVNREKTGRVVDRLSEDDWLKEDEYHLGIHVCIFNSKGEMLIQKRQITKKAEPNKWDVSGRGSTLKGETTWETAQREVFEELAINYDFSKERAKFTINSENMFDDYFIIKLDVDIKDVVLQEEEVADAKWATKEEIIKLMESGEFVKFSIELLNFIYSFYEEM